MININFTSPEYFFLLIPVFLLLVYLYRSDKKDIKFLFMKDLLSVYKRDSIFYKLKYALIFVIFIFFVSILSNPFSEEKKETIKQNGIDIEIILDVSYSMIATDLKPNRLEVAKGVINNFLDKLETDRAGIIVFSGKPFTSLPLTFDYNILKEVIRNIDEKTINQNIRDFAGTALGDALVLGKIALDSEEDREKIIILLTDGEANKGLEPLLALKLLKENNIKVYTIGIGGKEKTRVLVPTLVGNQIVEIGGIDEVTLKKIAEETSGKYFRADNKRTFEEIFEEISLLEKKEIEIEVMKVRKLENKIFLYFLILSMILLSFLIYKKG